MTKTEILERGVARGYFTTEDADLMGKCAAWCGASDMKKLGIDPDDPDLDMQGYFYSLHVFDCGDELAQAGVKLGLDVIQRGGFTIFSLL